MKNIRKLASLLLALVLMLSLAVPAMADDANPADAAKTYTVTITGHTTGHTYDAYQIFKGDLDESGVILSNIQWGDGIQGAKFLAFLTSADTTSKGIFSEVRLVNGVETTVPNIFANCVTANDVATILSSYADKDAMLDTFAKYAGEDEYLAAAPQGTSTAGSGNTYTISNLPAGYYLIKDRDNTLTGDALQNDFYTKFMLEVVGNVPVSVKGSVPSISKTTSDAAETGYGETTTAMIGETVYFELEATLPSNFDIYDDYYFTFEDTMSAGLTFKQIEKVYIRRTNETVVIDNAFIDAAPEDSSTTAIAVTKNEDGTSSFKVKVGNLKANDFPSLLQDNTIVVRYSATLNKNAIIAQDGNPNTVYLKYSNNPYKEGEGTTGPDVAVVFTFGLNIDKHDKADTTKKLQGAQFVLYRRELYTADGKELLKMHFVVIEDGKPSDWHVIDGIEVAATTELTWNNAKEKLSDEDLAKITLTTDENGQISVPGLDIHTYHMLEIKAPDGYNLPHDPFRVVMTPVLNEDGTVSMSYQYGSGESTTPDDGMANVAIANGKGNTLPATGGMGTTLFYLVGGLLVVSAAVLLVSKKRMMAE